MSANPKPAAATNEQVAKWKLILQSDQGLWGRTVVIALIERIEHDAARIAELIAANNTLKAENEMLEIDAEAAEADALADRVAELEVENRSLRVAERLHSGDCISHLAQLGNAQTRVNGLVSERDALADELAKERERHEIDMTAAEEKALRKYRELTLEIAKLRFQRAEVDRETGA